MDNTPQDVYAKYLPKNRGYPLWVPQLTNTHDLPREYQQDGIQIGDLGVVDTDSGFNVLLNVQKPADHPLHARWQNKGFPTFDPVCLNRQNITFKSNAIRCNTVISSGVTRINPPSCPSTEYEFAASSAEGAILILPEGAVFHDLIPKNRFRDLAIQHAFDWYRFAVRCLEWPIRNHSLYLVTGFFKARSWSLASFTSANPSDDSHRMWVTKAEEGDNTGNFNWVHAFHVEWNDGPQRGPNQNADQCIFLRGFKISLRDEMFGLVTQRVTDLVAGQELRGVVGCCGFSFLKWRFGRKKTPHMQRKASSETPSVDPTHEPKLSQPFHPSDTINRFLLDKDRAMTVAVTHDSEWIDFLDDERLSPYQLMQEGYFVQFLSEKCSFDPQHGVVYVEVGVERDEASLHASSEECDTTRGNKREPQRGLVTVAKISEPCDDSRTVHVITNMRGDQLIGFGCAPIECHVLVESRDRKRRTKDRPVRAGDVIVWDDLILLPSELSTTLRISVCAFSESASEVEELHAGEVTVEKLLQEEFIEFVKKGQDSNESSRPSLLFNTCHKNLDDLDDSNFRSREQSLRLARIAGQEGRWADVVNHMKDIALLDRELTPEERDLFSAGYEGLIAVNRVSCDSQNLESGIIRICEEVLDILEKHLIPSTTSTESVVFYGRLVGDYHRCASDFDVESRRRKCMTSALSAYEGASGIAKSGLLATHPIRLHLAVNFSLFYYEVLHKIDLAICVAEKALEDMRAGLEGLGERECSESAPVLQSLRDNVTHWKLEEKEKHEDGQSRGENEVVTDEVPNVEHDKDPDQVRRHPPLHPRSNMSVRLSSGGLEGLGSDPALVLQSLRGDVARSKLEDKQKHKDRQAGGENSDAMEGTVEMTDEVSNIEHDKDPFRLRSNMPVHLVPKDALGFSRPFTRLVKKVLLVSNQNSVPVAFKVKATAPKLYCVRPNSCRIEPGDSIEVSVILQPLKEEPPLNAKCKDKFLIQSTLITPEKETMDIQDIWNVPDGAGEEWRVHQQKLRVVYLPPSEDQSVPEEDEDAAEPQHVPASSMFVHLVPNNALGFNRPFIRPVEKVLLVSNQNSVPVAFKVKTTAPKLYCTRPNLGRIEPGDSIEVSITLQPMKEEPPLNAKCKDKFLIQSTPITPEKETKDLRDIWHVPSGTGEEWRVHQQKLRVVYLPPEGQSVPEEDEVS